MGGRPDLRRRPRRAFLDLYGSALLSAGGPLADGGETSACAETGLRLVVRRAPGGHTVITSPQGRLELVDLDLKIVAATSGVRDAPRSEAGR